MTKLFTIIFLTFLSPTLFIASSDGDVMRRIQKRINKVYKTSSFQLSKLIDIPTGYQDATSAYSYFNISDGGQSIGHVVHGMTHVCYFGGCTSFTDQSKNVNREEVEYIIYFDEKQQIKYIEIIDFESNYGYEIAAKWWLKQFYHKRPGSFSLGDDIDGISGATVSCEQFVMAVNELVVE